MKTIVVRKRLQEVRAILVLVVREFQSEPRMFRRCLQMDEIIEILIQIGDRISNQGRLNFRSSTLEYRLRN